MSFTVLGTGSALPGKTVHNDDLAKFIETSDEWITSRTGIKKRQVCTNENLTDLATLAAQRALADGGCSAAELDLIICATMSADYATPSLACLVQKRLGAKCPAFDVNAACTGVLYGLDIAAGYFSRRPQQKILVVGADAISRLVDWRDRGTCVLFGDGAGALLLGAGEDLLAIHISASGNESPLYACHDWGNSPFRENAVSDRYLHMDGQAVFRFAVTAMVQMVEMVLAQAKLTQDDIAYILPHQANRRIIEAATSRLHLPMEKCLTNISEHGNISAACIAILLDEAARTGKLQRGDKLILTAFGGGLTTGACILRWNK